MDEFSQLEDCFLFSLKRAEALCDLQAYMQANHTNVLDTTDMLRASVVLCVSAFDYLMHEAYRLEVGRRHKNGKKIKRLSVPFEVTIARESDRQDMIDAHVRETNSYKSFVDPKKISEALGCFIDDPWKNISNVSGQPQETLKTQLRLVYKWRNRIAHEADINPAYAGAQLWPIMREDVRDAIRLLESLGSSIITALRAS